MTDSLKSNKDAKYLECQRMKIRYPTVRDAIRFMYTSSKKYIKSEVEEAFEKVEFDHYDTTLMILPLGY
jgi:hypothetical protein